MENVEYGLVVSFPDQSQAFTLGVEAGMIWQRIESGERKIEATTRVENRELLTRYASATGLALDVQPAGVEGWDAITMYVAKKPKLRLVKGGLTDTEANAGNQR